MTKFQMVFEDGLCTALKMCHATYKLLVQQPDQPTDGLPTSLIAIPKTRTQLVSLAISKMAVQMTEAGTRKPLISHYWITMTQLKKN